MDAMSGMLRTTARLFWLTLWTYVATCHDAQEIILSGSNKETSTNGLAISSVWQGLGPFKIGTREAVWGADPLEAFGGFSNLNHAKHTEYPSSLVPNATLGWSEFAATLSQTTDTVTVGWTISYPDIDWRALQDIYGWSALQYQTWIRGEVHNRFPLSRCVSLTFNNILEFSINGENYFGGDFYGFGKAPLRVSLKPGRNIFNIRLIRDVRSQGGLHPATIVADVTLEPCLTDVRVLENSLVLPELVDGKISSCYIGASVQNLGAEPIELHQCQDDNEQVGVDLISDEPVKIAPGQTIPLTFGIRSGSCGSYVAANSGNVHLCYKSYNHVQNAVSKRLSFAYSFKERSADQARTITFLHPAGVVSYALLKPPLHIQENASQIPLMVNLHGAGVDVDSEMVRHALDLVTDLNAVALFPSGSSTWSGDDWHTVGFADVLAAIDAVKDWQFSGQWKGPSIDTSRFMLVGHSNGGQGTWFITARIPDRVFAAISASAYTSIENYVPYDFWNIADQSRILDVARKPYRNELFLTNMESIPLLQQHGSLDDNVPPYHSRLMSSLRAQAQMEFDYFEVPNENHWWDGALTTKPIKRFYQQHLTGVPKQLVVPKSFSYIVSNSHDTNSRFGIVVDQLRSPDQLGRIDVHVDVEDGTWHIRTSNIHRFHFDTESLVDVRPRKINLDHASSSRSAVNGSYVLSPMGVWLAGGAQWQTISARYGRQRGSMDAVLRSQGPFQVVDFTNKNEALAVQISLNLLQYFGMASTISSETHYNNTLNCNGNLITLSTGLHVPAAQLQTFPITISSDGITLRTKERPHRRIQFSSGLGLAMLRPLPNQRLELLLWGHDEAGLRQAMRLALTLTGAGQPDFAILSHEARWKGHGGALALGFFDHEWEISGGSYVW